MKNRILTLMTISPLLLITGCSNAPEENLNPAEKKQQQRQQEKKLKIESASITKYIFGDTLKVTFPPVGTIGSGAQYRGQISPKIRPLIENIWMRLQAKGFSGYDAQPFLKEEARLVYAEEDSLIGGFFGFTPQNEKEFHFRVINYLMKDFYDVQTLHYDSKKLKYASSLLGLKWNNRMFIPVIADDRKIVYVLDGTNRLTLRDSKMPTKIPSDIEVSDTQIEEWNQVFVDALKADPFFKDFADARAPADSSGSLALHAGRTGRLGMDATGLNLHGVQGSYIDLGLPVYIQLKGTVDGHTHTTDSQSVVAYRIGNALIGAAHTYANTGVGFGVNGRQSETSVVASYNFGACFVEGQLGHVSAKDINFKDWSGVRSQLTLGYDFNWGAPFVQAVHRDFGKTTDTAAYAGVEVNLSEIKGDTYTFTTNGVFKVGYHSKHDMVGMLELRGSLNLNNGISFSSNLTLGTLAETTAGLCINLSQ